MKFRGPCIKCGQTKDQQYIRKMCIACYQKFHRYDEAFEPRKKYQGPCVQCGTFESIDGRFTRKMCRTCYSRFNEGWSARKPKYQGPCVDCGTFNSKTGNFVEKRCAKCYRVYSYGKKHPKQDGACEDCGKVLESERRKIVKRKRCTNCYMKWKRATDPAYAKREKDRQNRYYSTSKGLETRRGLVRKRRARIAQVENTLTREEWQDVLAKYGRKCAYCGSTKKIEMDHIIPISKGGTHTKRNVVPACRTCNSRKSNRQVLKPIQPLLL